MDLLVFFPNGRMTSKRTLLWLVMGITLVVMLLVFALRVSADAPVHQPQSITAVSPSLPTDRPRPRMVGNTIITGDTGVRLRGENPRRDDRASRNAPAFWADLRDNYHMNVVRILVYRPPQNYFGGCGTNCNLPTATQVIPDLDEWVDRASENGFYVIIDYHPVGGRDETDATDWWRVIAPRYKNRTHVIYEVTNEPGGAGVGLAGYEERMRQRIRADAPDTPLILWSVENARDDNVNAILQNNPQINANWNNAIVGLHMYWDYNYTSVQGLKNAYPLMNTEIGGWNENDYMKVTNDAESLGISWIWLDGATAGRVPPSSVYWSADPYFSGNTPPPAGTPTPTPTAPPSTPTPSPTPTPAGTPAPTPTPGGSTTIQLPGRLEAEDYRTGGEGVGYHDTTTGNNGNMYRSDDVDIQSTNDTSGAYNVGWTAAGEWLAYDVTVSKTDYYDLIARVASGAGGTKTIHIELDGVDITGAMNTTRGDGWQTWDNLIAANIRLTAGTHTLKIVFDTPSLNLNYLNVVSSLSVPTNYAYSVFLPVILR